MFTLKIGEYRLKGKIDRIDQADGGVEIIDYKTGSFKEKLSAEDKDQLLIYQIAAEEIFGLKPRKLTYYYLEKNKRNSFLGKESDKLLQKQKIIKKIEEMEKSGFNPTPGRECRWCDYNGICEFAQR
jgi:RecB family exonuclease